jgi:hypothetical protein
MSWQCLYRYAKQKSSKTAFPQARAVEQYPPIDSGRAETGGQRANYELLWGDIRSLEIGGELRGSLHTARNKGTSHVTILHHGHGQVLCWNCYVLRLTTFPFRSVSAC